MLTRWQPFGDVRNELDRLHDEMNRLFGRWGTNGLRAFAPTAYPALNLWEDEGSLHVEAELPGFELKDLELDVTGENQLSIKGHRNQPELGKGSWHRQERGYGEFSRVIELPYPVDSERVAAEFNNGVLTVVLPKRETARARRIAVRAN